MRPTLRLFDGFPHTAADLATHVAEMQNALQAKGYPIKITGLYNYYTDGIVRHFQASQAMHPDGICGPETWAKLANAHLLRHYFYSSYAIENETLLADLNRYTANYRPVVHYICKKLGLQECVVVALGSKLSSWGRKADNQEDVYGLFQLAVNANDAQFTIHQLVYIGRLLKGRIQSFSEATGATGFIALKGALASLNCGLEQVIEAYTHQLDLDFYTQGGNFSSDVLSRAGWFQLKGIEGEFPTN
jgi:hypothetical protein